MFSGFDEFDIKVNDITIHGVKGGSGTPLLLLHGYPQTHVIWHKIAPRLAENYTVIATDLRGYGESSKPPGGDGHKNYTFRAMAKDQVAVMNKLGFGSFLLAGHDRGARTAHRLALDNPTLVKKLMLMDIVPTVTFYETANQRIATGYYHWYFLIQPHDFPERLIGRDPEYFLRRTIGSWSSNKTFSESALETYIKCFCNPETIHASCEDYRAAASVDLNHDRNDRQAGIKIQCPTLILWGRKGLIGKTFNVMETWRDKVATEFSGQGLLCGHFLPEEAPDATFLAMTEFLSATTSAET